MAGHVGERDPLCFSSLCVIHTKTCWLVVFAFRCYLSSWLHVGPCLLEAFCWSGYLAAAAAADPAVQHVILPVVPCPAGGAIITEMVLTSLSDMRPWYGSLKLVEGAI